MGQNDTKPPKNKIYKLNIFDVLRKINTKDRNYYSKLSSEEKKAFQPIVIMRWLSGVEEQRQIVYINELVNNSVFGLHAHKELLYKLMTICGNGTNKRCKWIKAGGSVTTPIILDMIQGAFNYTRRDAEYALERMTKADILDLAIGVGMQPTDITKLKREIKKLKL